MNQSTVPCSEACRGDVASVHGTSFGARRPCRVPSEQTPIFGHGYLYPWPRKAGVACYAGGVQCRTDIRSPIVMTTNDPHTPSVPRKPRSIGTLAARKRLELNQFEAARRRSIERLNHKRAELARTVAEAEAQERRRLRNEQMADQKRLKFVLGGIMLEALRTQGLTSLTITEQDLHRLGEKDRQLLDDVLAEDVNALDANAPEGKPDAGSAHDGVDV